MRNSLAYTNTDGLIHLAKVGCGITADNKDLTDDQIANICKFIAQYAPDNKCHPDGTIEYGEIGIGIMVSIALYAFPEFYQRKGLMQWN